MTSERILTSSIQMVNQIRDESRADGASSRPEITVPDRALQISARLAAGLQDGQQVILVTGYGPEDGATDLAAQLALGLGSVSHQRVALIDAERQSPTLHSLFGLPLSPGLADFAAGNPEAAVAVTDSLSVIPAGDEREALPVPACVAACATLRSRYRYIIIAAASLSTSTEALSFATLSDGVVLAIRAGIRNRNQIQDLKREVARLRLPLLGAVLREET